MVLLVSPNWTSHVLDIFAACFSSVNKGNYLFCWFYRVTFSLLQFQFLFIVLNFICIFPSDLTGSILSILLDCNNYLVAQPLPSSSSSTLIFFSVVVICDSGTYITTRLHPHLNSLVSNHHIISSLLRWQFRHSTRNIRLKFEPLQIWYDQL